MKRTEAVGRRLYDGWWQVKLKDKTIYWTPTEVSRRTSPQGVQG